MAYNLRNNNPLDNLITRQGQMSDRAKSPRRVNSNLNQNYNSNQPHYQHQYELYPISNPNRLQSERTMSPNKLVAKGKPLLSPRQRAPFTNTSNVSTNQHNASMLESNRLNNNFNNGFIPGYQLNQVNNQNFYEQNLHTQPALITKFKSPRSNLQVNSSSTEPCSNHRDKLSEFAIDIDGSYQYFCKMCAARLAAQGFPVIKLFPQQSSNHPLLHKKLCRNNQFARLEIPNYPQYNGNKIYETIIEFLKQIQSVQVYHIENIQKFSSMEQHYQNQISLVQDFYKNLKDIVDHMRNDHLEDLKQFKEKHSQQADIYLNDLYDSMENIQNIAKDATSNIHEIVTKLQSAEQQCQEQFWDFLNSNRKIVRMSKHEVENQRDMLRNVPDYKQERLQEMVKQFQGMLTSLWEQERHEDQISKNLHPINSQNQRQVLNPLNCNLKNTQPTQNHLNYQQKQQFVNNKSQNNDKRLNIKEIHNNLPKNNLAREFEGKSACRVIFDDNELGVEEEHHQGLEDKVSPNFKKI